MQRDPLNVRTQERHLPAASTPRALGGPWWSEGTPVGGTCALDFRGREGSGLWDIQRYVPRSSAHDLDDSRCSKKSRPVALKEHTA